MQWDFSLITIQELKGLNEWCENKHLKDFMLQDKESLVISLKQEKEKFESDLVQCQHDLAQAISDGLRRKVAMHAPFATFFAYACLACAPGA